MPITIMGFSGNSPAVKALKWQALYGSLAKRLALRTLMFALVLIMLPLMQLVCDNDPAKPLCLSSDGCDPDVGYLGPDSWLARVIRPVAPIAFPKLMSRTCEENANVTINVVNELMGKNLLNSDAKALCIGQESASARAALYEMGFSFVDEIRRNPFFTFKQKQVLCKLDFEDNSFDFVIARDLDQAIVPALLVSEVERVLKPGGSAAMIVGMQGSGHDGLIRSATSVSSFLKRSNVVHVVNLGTFTLVAFKKRANTLGSFEVHHLPSNCPSIKRSKAFVNNIEPIVQKKPQGDGVRTAYLPSFVDVSSKGKLVYIDVGSKEAANFSSSNWFLPSYPVDSKAFIAYIVDHDASILSSHVKSPGVNFIYHPALAKSGLKDRMKYAAADEEPLIGDEEFNFFIWFKEIVEASDFVVLKMNLGKYETQFLSELFESGVICHVDELFLLCPGGESCSHVFKSLREVGVYAHQWWAN